MLKVIYQPKGRAAEYNPWAANLYRGCGHNCEYCYAPSALQMPAQEFRQPKPRIGILDKLVKDAAELQSQCNNLKILLCFSCDPYQSINDQHQLARQAIEVLHFYGQSVVILTKGGYRALPDIPLLKDGDEFAVTLTCDNEADSLKWEPGAAIPAERIDTLREANARGIFTWVSLEPVLYPGQVMNLIDQTHEFVSKYKVGTLNYHPRSKEIDWRKFAGEVVAKLESVNADYYVKEDLRKWL